MPIHKLDVEICTGCKICIDACPEDVIHFNENERKAYIKYPQDCVACLLCEYFCPVNCIEVSWDMARPIPIPY